MVRGEGALTKSWVLQGGEGAVGFGGKTHTPSHQKEEGRKHPYQNTHGPTEMLLTSSQYSTSLKL